MQTQRDRSRGDASVVLLLAITIVVIGIAAALFASSTAATATEVDRYVLDRAKLNARNGTVEMDEWLQTEVSQTIKELLEQASQQHVDFSTANLESIRFPDYEKRFAMSGIDATSDDYALVDATVSLAGTPIARTIGGATGEGAPSRVDEYHFRVRMTSTGYAKGGGLATYAHESDVYVELEVGPEP